MLFVRHRTLPKLFFVLFLCISSCRLFSVNDLASSLSLLKAKLLSLAVSLGDGGSEVKLEKKYIWEALKKASWENGAIEEKFSVATTCNNSTDWKTLVADESKFTEEIKKIDVNSSEFLNYFSKENVLETNIGFECKGLASCACSNFIRESRQAFALLQAKEISENFPVKNFEDKPLVHVSLAAGGLLQTYMLVWLLCKKGYKHIVVYAIDPLDTVKKLESFKDIVKKYSKQGVKIDIFHYDYTWQYVKDVKEGKASAAHSFDLVDAAETHKTPAGKIFTLGNKNGSTGAFNLINYVFPGHIDCYHAFVFYFRNSALLSLHFLPRSPYYIIDEEKKIGGIYAIFDDFAKNVFNLAGLKQNLQKNIIKDASDILMFIKNNAEKINKHISENKEGMVSEYAKNNDQDDYFVFHLEMDHHIRADFINLVDNARAVENPIIYEGQNNKIVRHKGTVGNTRPDCFGK